MKSKYFASMLIIILGFLVGGCQFEKTTPQPTPVVELSDPTETPEIIDEKPTETAIPVVFDPWSEIDPSNQNIIFWHIFSGERERAIAKLVEDFNSSNLFNIQVQAGSQGSYIDLYNKMLEVAGTNEIPNLLIAFQSQAADFQHDGELIDLTSLIESPTWGISESERQAFFPGIWQQDIFPNLGEQRLGIPFYRSVDLIYFNADWLQELGYSNPPTNPEEFKEMACAAAKHPFNQESLSQSTGTILYADATRLASWVFAFGGELYDVDTNRLNLNSDIVKGVLAYQQSLIKEGCAAKSTNWSYDQDQFVQGNTLFIMDSSNLITYFGELTKSGQINFNWNVAPYPHLLNESVSNTYGASLSVGDSSPEKELAAFIFLKYLITTESQVSWAITSGTLPVRSDSAHPLANWFTEYPEYQIAYNLISNSKSEPSIQGYDFVRKEIEDASNAIYEGGIVDTISEALNIKANEIISSEPE